MALRRFVTVTDNLYEAALTPLQFWHLSRVSPPVPLRQQLGVKFNQPTGRDSVTTGTAAVQRSRRLS